MALSLFSSFVKFWWTFRFIFLCLALISSPTMKPHISYPYLSYYTKLVHSSRSPMLLYIFPRCHLWPNLNLATILRGFSCLKTIVHIKGLHSHVISIMEEEGDHIVINAMVEFHLPMFFTLVSNPQSCRTVYGTLACLACHIYDPFCSQQCLISYYATKQSVIYTNLVFIQTIVILYFHVNTSDEDCLGFQLLQV